MSLLAQLNDALSDVIGGAQKSVVQIRDGRTGQGAGTIWHADGLIVTNAHVAHRSPLEVVLPDGRTISASVIARDDERDLAALTVEANGLPTIQPGDSRGLHAGQWVMAVGHPWGILNAVTGGIVIGVGKQMPDLRVFTQDWVVADLHLRPGNSGGPMIDTGGRLIGVNTLMTGPSVGAAVAVDVVKDFLKRAFNGASIRVETQNRPHWV